MKKFLFMVVLEGMQTEVEAFTSEQAVILAQAEAINYGLDYELISVTMIY